MGAKKVQVMGVVLCLLFAGCATSKSTQGTMIKERDVCGIEKGKTTRSEILKNFGAPDRIIDAGLTGESKTSVAGDVNLSSHQNISLGKNQEIYIYEYTEESGRFFAISAFARTNTRKLKNTLMIWIDKDTGIVQDYGYKKEI